MHSKPEEKNWRSKVPSFNFKQAVMTAEALKKKKNYRGQRCGYYLEIHPRPEMEESKVRLNLPASFSFSSFCFVWTWHSSFSIQCETVSSSRRKAGARGWFSVWTAAASWLFWQCSHDLFVWINALDPVHHTLNSPCDNLTILHVSVFPESFKMPVLILFFSQEIIVLDCSSPDLRHRLGNFYVKHKAAVCSKNSRVQCNWMIRSSLCSNTHTGMLVPALQLSGRFPPRWPAASSAGDFTFDCVVDDALKSVWAQLDSLSSSGEEQTNGRH